MVVRLLSASHCPLLRAVRILPEERLWLLRVLEARLTVLPQPTSSEMGPWAVDGVLGSSEPVCQNKVMLPVSAPSPRAWEKKGISDKLLVPIGSNKDLSQNKWLQPACKCPLSYRNDRVRQGCWHECQRGSLSEHTG